MNSAALVGIAIVPLVANGNEPVGIDGILEHGINPAAEVIFRVEVLCFEPQGVLAVDLAGEVGSHIVTMEHAAMSLQNFHIVNQPVIRQINFQRLSNL